MSKNPIVLPPKKSFPVTSFSRNISISRISSIATSIPFSAFTRGMKPTEYLLINELGPEPNHGLLVGIVR
ncbi:unnamed protein product [Arabidopsis thaliana]|uniref:Uncharacterized protein n=2 Tax=Arabidopsis thaliana TaxID=3702 RepID=A0A654F2B6_ARATH|nr:uncharacterized protein AT2G29485 [Arabidopsis thaliana]ANM62169.1 hypothetical protein AT2G29485 [Arabidopsis thaliana]CAA0373217.1 unnamed protein product [Arabidopsis thaliana]VYS53892.1 unnamed protein product [Arabidopsis thaliana]|eukprot:NP_001324347.1 hypothetical protein AT2G29485 [Arabidopsis thaliana]